MKLLKKHFLTISIVITTIFLDLITKYSAKKYLADGDLDLIFGMKFQLAFNSGVAFSLPIKGLIQILLSFALLGFLIYFTNKTWDFKKLIPKISLGLIIGGALGNLYERILFQKVTDFISVFSWYPTFNLADAFVFIGVCLAIYYEWNLQKK